MEYEIVQQSNPIQSKRDVNRIRVRAGSRKTALNRIRSIVEMYEQGRAASACMDEIAKTMKVVK